MRLHRRNGDVQFALQRGDLGVQAHLVLQSSIELSLNIIDVGFGFGLLIAQCLAQIGVGRG
jgi:hypothetical protein